MRRDERGIALVLAVFVLSVIGALVVAVFFAGVQEHRMIDATRHSQRAVAAAEARVAEVLRQWPDDAGSLAPYPGEGLLVGQGVVIRRLGDDLYLVTDARNTLGMLVHLAAGCNEPIVEEVEMTNSNCPSDTVLQNRAAPLPLGSRALTYTF